MNANPTPIVVVSTEDLRSIIREAVAEALEGANSTPQKTLITKEELAQILSCSTYTVQRMIKEGMPHVRLGRAQRFDTEACQEWCAKRTRKDPTSNTNNRSVFSEGVRLVHSSRRV